MGPPGESDNGESTLLFCLAHSSLVASSSLVALSSLTLDAFVSDRTVYSVRSFAAFVSLALSSTNYVPLFARCRFLVCRVTLFLGLSCGVIARLVAGLRLRSFFVFVHGFTRFCLLHLWLHRGGGYYFYIINIGVGLF